MSLQNICLKSIATSLAEEVARFPEQLQTEILGETRQELEDRLRREIRTELEDELKAKLTTRIRNQVFYDLQQDLPPLIEYLFHDAYRVHRSGGVRDNYVHTLRGLDQDLVQVLVNSLDDLAQQVIHLNIAARMGYASSSSASEDDDALGPDDYDY